jgi:uncharacterized coiled-coil DUF342 family protein
MNIGSINFAPVNADLLINENTILREQIKHLEQRLADARKATEEKNKIQSLTAIINYAINEFPDSIASRYLRDVMDRMNETQTHN